MQFIFPHLMERKHRMKTVVLLLGFTAVLRSNLVGGLRCHQCSTHEPGRKCIPDQFPCETEPGESCSVQQLLLEKTSLSIVAGCRPNCKDENTGHFLRSVLKCCSRDLCNVP